MKGGTRSQSGRKPKKGSPLPKERRGFRKVHISGKAWQWKWTSYKIVVYSPKGTLYLMPASYGDSYYEQYYTYTPGDVKKWIQSHLDCPAESIRGGSEKKAKYARIAHNGRLIEFELNDCTGSQEFARSYVVRTLNGKESKSTSVPYMSKTVKQLSEELIKQFVDDDVKLLLEAVAEGIDECHIWCI